MNDFTPSKDNPARLVESMVPDLPGSLQHRKGCLFYKLLLLTLEIETNTYAVKSRTGYALSFS